MNSTTQSTQSTQSPRHRPPSPSRQLLRVALTKFHLFQAPSRSPEVLAAISAVTGIPVATLLLADRRMALTGSLTPLRDLFRNPAVPKAGSLRYELTLQQTQVGMPAYHQQLGQLLTLTLASEHGRVEVRLTVVLNRRPRAHAPEQRSATISVSYHIGAGTMHQAFHHEVTIAKAA